MCSRKTEYTFSFCIVIDNTKTNILDTIMFDKLSFHSWIIRNNYFDLGFIFLLNSHMHQ